MTIANLNVATYPRCGNHINELFEFHEKWAQLPSVQFMNMYFHS